MERKRKEMKCQTGRWTQAESRRFMNAIEKYGRNWFEVQKKVKTRSIPQIRSHAQKMFLNLPEEDIQALFSLPKSQSETIVNCKPGNGSEKKEFKSLKQKTGINA